MKKFLLVSLSLTASMITSANEVTIVLSPEAKFSNPDGVSDDIRSDCNLTTQQLEAVRREAISLGIPVSIAAADEVPVTGKYAQIRIEGAYSSGHAFVGHSKQVSSSVTLFENGQKVASTTFTRNSSGGMGANFKSSCSVLVRCTDRLGVDMAKWLKRQLKGN